MIFTDVVCRDESWVKIYRSDVCSVGIGIGVRMVGWG